MTNLGERNVTTDVTLAECNTAVRESVSHNLTCHKMSKFRTIHYVNSVV